ncbi:hypothetical protein SMICM304S_04242 [Streptomyces microflavus]
MDLAVPASPTRRSPRSPARVTTHRSTRARSPTNFCSITRRSGTPSGRAPFGRLSASPALPITKVTTARGVSSQPGGRGPGRGRRGRPARWRTGPRRRDLAVLPAGRRRLAGDAVRGGAVHGGRGVVGHRRGLSRAAASSSSKAGASPPRTRAQAAANSAGTGEVGQGPGGTCHGVQAFLPGLQRQPGGAAFEPAAGEEQSAAGAGALRLHDEAGGGEFRPRLLDPGRLPLGPADAVAVRRVGQGEQHQVEGGSVRAQAEGVGRLGDQVRHRTRRVLGLGGAGTRRAPAETNSSVSSLSSARRASRSPVP